MPDSDGEHAGEAGADVGQVQVAGALLEDGAGAGEEARVGGAAAVLVDRQRVGADGHRAVVGIVAARLTARRRPMVSSASNSQGGVPARRRA